MLLWLVAVIIAMVLNYCYYHYYSCQPVLVIGTLKPLVTTADPNAAKPLGHPPDSQHPLRTPAERFVEGWGCRTKAMIWSYDRAPSPGILLGWLVAWLVEYVHWNMCIFSICLAVFPNHGWIRPTNAVTTPESLIHQICPLAYPLRKIVGFQWADTTCGPCGGRRTVGKTLKSTQKEESRHQFRKAVQKIRDSAESRETQLWITAAGWSVAPDLRKLPPVGQLGNDDSLAQLPAVVDATEKSPAFCCWK